jgi:tyrosyl-tRNA synthetase
LTPDREPVSAGALAEGSVECLPECELARLIETGAQLRVKLGIDPTAPDIHLGHVVVLDKLADFQRAGHRVVLIIGDFTARVGDPSGRSAQRPILAPEEIAANAETFKEQAFKVLDPDLTEVRFNSEWLDMGTPDLLGLLSRATVARLLEREDFRSRMEEGSPVSLLELLYPLLQGYDSVAIESDIELGGTDQKFNLLFGRDIQSAFDQSQQAVMTMPILPGTDGVNRMSKSLGNYVGVTDEPAEMFGKLMSIPDEAMPNYWELLLRRSPPTDAQPNAAKRELARRLVDRFWGSGSGAEAEEAFDRVFVRHEAPEDLDEFQLTGEDVHLPELLGQAFGISRSEARRLIGQGGVRIDGERADPERFEYPHRELEGTILQLGKRRFVRLQG